MVSLTALLLFLFTVSALIMFMCFTVRLLSEELGTDFLLHQKTLLAICVLKL